MRTKVAQQDPFRGHGQECKDSRCWPREASSRRGCETGSACYCYDYGVIFVQWETYIHIHYAFNPHKQSLLLLLLVTIVSV